MEQKQKPLLKDHHAMNWNVSYEEFNSILSNYTIVNYLFKPKFLQNDWTLKK